MKILSLGCGGFIGAHLTAHLLSKHHDVTGVDIHADKIQEFMNHNRLNFIKQDIRQNNFDLDALVSEADVVIDLIAHANPGIYVKHPLDVFKLNFNENLKIAESCVAFKKRLIQFSSCEVYGKTIASIIPEKLENPEDPSFALFSEETTDFVLGPVSKHRWIYACAKQLLERVLHAYGLEGKLNYTIIRPFNFIGPKIDYLPADTEGVPRVFSYFMEALMTGTAIKLVDGGAQRRCYTYIDDAIECIGRIIENKNNGCDCQIFNIGSPHNEVSIRELAVLMKDIYAERFKKPDVPLPDIIAVSADEFYGKGYEDSDRRIPDITKARTMLGWEPVYKLKEALGHTMTYYVDEYLHSKKSA